MNDTKNEAISCFAREKRHSPIRKTEIKLLLKQFHFAPDRKSEEAKSRLESLELSIVPHPVSRIVMILQWKGETVAEYRPSEPCRTLSGFKWKEASRNLFIPRP